MSHIERLYSDRAAKMRKSEIRELLKVAQDPEVISFAGGLPSPSTFPLDDLQGVAKTVLKNHGNVALQYGTTQGLVELREAIAERSCKDGMDITADNVMITSGSQQALDTVGKLFFNPGDFACVGLPTYLGGINAFKSYEANLTGIPLDKDGIIVDLVDDAIKNLTKKGITAKFIYVVPTFQNPAGVVMPESRRKHIIMISLLLRMIRMGSFDLILIIFAR